MKKPAAPVKKTAVATKKPAVVARKASTAKPAGPTLGESAQFAAAKATVAYLRKKYPSLK